MDSFWQPGVDPAVLRMRHEAYSTLRHEKMKALREVRGRAGGPCSWLPCVCAQAEAPLVLGSRPTPVRVFVCVQARRAVMQEEADGVGGGGKHAGRSASPGKSVGRGDTSRSGPLVSGTIDLDKVKKRQQKEIESMMAYEMKMQEVAEEQERRQVCPCLPWCVWLLCVRPAARVRLSVWWLWASPCLSRGTRVCARCA